MRPVLPRPARSIIERQLVVLSRCVFADGLPDNGILPELDDRQIIAICLQPPFATGDVKSQQLGLKYFLIQPMDICRNSVIRSQKCLTIKGVKYE